MKNKVLLLILYIFICLTILGFELPDEKQEYLYLETVNTTNIVFNEFEEKYNEYQETHYFKGEHIDTITKKLNRLLNSSLKNKGRFIAEYSLKQNVDPYLVPAVILQETGCYWSCSRLAKSCNNYGGQKGNPSCNGGAYRRFKTKNEGLKFTIRKIAGYYNDGKTTANKIGPSYATSKTWATKVNNYIKKLKK